MLETVFLAVLVLALLLGNAFLSITGPKRPKLVPEEEMLRQDALASQAVALPLVSGQRAIERLVVAQPAEQNVPAFETRPSFEEDAERERIEYLTRRIARLEQLLLKINNPRFVAEKVNLEGFYHKLKDMDSFKQNTRLEIAALKQRLDKIQPVESKPKLEISDEKLRDLVFRASH